MSDTQQGSGWWLASDGKWYPPESWQHATPPPTTSSIPAWLLPANVSGWAVAAGYLGLVTFILFGLPGPFALFAGLKGRQAIERQPGLNGTVRCWVGIVLGGLGTVVLLLVAAAFVFGR